MGGGSERDEVKVRGKVRVRVRGKRKEGVRE
jgi:hypothetical protein